MKEDIEGLRAKLATGDVTVTGVGFADDLMAEVGKIVVGFAVLEDALAELIVTFVSMGFSRDMGQILSCELTYNQRIGVIDSVLLLFKGRIEKTSQEVLDQAGLIVPADAIALITRFSTLKPGLFKAQELRNSVVHAGWAHREDGTMVRTKATAKAKKGLNVKTETFTLSQLKEITSEIWLTYSHLILFAHDIAEPSE